MKLRPFYHGQQPDLLLGYTHWCPGCGGPHAIYVTHLPSEPGATWSFDGNMDEPTFAPSIRVFTTGGKWDDSKPPKWIAGTTQHTLCHYFVQQGCLVFCADSPHEYAGKTVPMIEMDADGRPIK